jgi:hypothetical protein
VPFTPEVQRLIEIAEIKLELQHGMTQPERVEVMRRFRLAQEQKRAAARQPRPLATMCNTTKRPGTGPLRLGTAGK